MAAVREIAGGGVDAAFVTVGAPAAIGSAAEALAPGGAVVVVGMPPSGTVVGFDPTALAAMNQKILGSRMGETVLARDIPWLIDHWRAGRLKLAELVSGRYPLEAINEALEATRSGKARRTVVFPGAPR